MMANEIRTSMKTVYGMLGEVLALYEKRDCYNKVPEGEKEDDIWDYMGDYPDDKDLWEKCYRKSEYGLPWSSLFQRRTDSER